MVTKTRGPLSYYLGLVYPFNVIADADGGYVLEFSDLPGCITQVEGAEEIGTMAEEARRLWITTEYEEGEDIPLPSYPETYSGRFNVRLPRSLHRRLVELAAREGVSLNQCLISLLARAEAESRESSLSRTSVLPPREGGPMNVQTYLFPHSPAEFRGTREVGEFLRGELRERGGDYFVATNKNYRRVAPGSLVLFHKNRELVGQAEVAAPLSQYDGREISPATGRRYEAKIRFDAQTIKTYKRPVTFDEVEAVTGVRINPRTVQRLDSRVYEKLEPILTAASDN